MTRETLSGELDYRIRYDVEHDLFHAQNVFNDEYIKPTFIEYVQKLEAQIAKMKNFQNCDYQLHIIDCPVFKSGGHISCKKCPHWVMQEIKEK